MNRLAIHAVARTLMVTLSLPSALGVLSLQAAAQTAQNTTYTYLYDNLGNLTQVTDALGNVSNLSYDPLSRVKQQVRPVPTAGVARPTTNFTYDGRDQASTIVDPRSLTTTYTQDGLGNRSALASPDTGGTALTFDGAGNVLTSTDARGKVTSFSYDALNRLTRIGYASGTATVFEYDGGTAGAANAIGRLTKITDESGQTDYSYDQEGRVLGKLQRTVTAAGTLSRQIAYGYNANGQLTSLTYPSGNRINYAYDAAGHVRQLTLNPADGVGGTNLGTAQVLVDKVTYAAFGALQGWDWGNSSEAAPNSYARTFDLDGRVATYPLGSAATLPQGVVRTVSYDAGNRITGYAHSGGATAALHDQSFGYDGLGRLTSFVNSTSTQGYGYDATGNRVRLSIGAATFTNTISATSNRLTATTGPVPAKTNEIDSAGNLTSDGTTSFVYSARGRLQSATKAGLTTNYLYNGLGQRVGKAGAAVASGANAFVYDEAGQLIGEYDAAGAVLLETVWLNGTPLAALKLSSAPDGTVVPLIYYLYVDHIATPRVLVDAASGAMVWNWIDADPFGMTPPNDAPNGGASFTFNLRFPGQYFDRETNLHYNYYRDYDPQTGRYVQSDPIGLNGGMNTYAYVDGNPLAHSDFLGLAPGDLYRTADKAAVAAIRDIYPRTAASGNEWGGRVYRLPNGKYSYTVPAEGNGKDMGKVPSLICPDGGTNQGMYHTHPNVPTYFNGTGNPNIVSGGDQDWAEKEHGPIYVGTPNGNILKYMPNGTPFDGPVSIIGKIK